MYCIQGKACQDRFYRRSATLHRSCKRFVASQLLVIIYSRRYYIMSAQCVWRHTLVCQLLPCPRTHHYGFFVRASPWHLRGGACSCHRNDCCFKTYKQLVFVLSYKKLLLYSVLCERYHFQPISTVGSLSYLTPPPPSPPSRRGPNMWRDCELPVQILEIYCTASHLLEPEWSADRKSVAVDGVIYTLDQFG